MKLKPDFIGCKALAGKPGPLESVFAFLDVLFGGSMS
jgi:hypothetical protein